MVRSKEKRPVGERLGTVDVPERPDQRQRREQDNDGGAGERAFHEPEVYASGGSGYFTSVIAT